MGHNDGIVGVQVPPNRAFQRFPASRCQCGTGSALQVRLHLSADLFEFFLSYRHNNGSTSIRGNPSIVTARLSGSPILKNGRPLLSLRGDTFLHIGRVTAGFSERVSLFSIQIAALELPNNLQHIRHRHRREFDQ